MTQTTHEATFYRCNFDHPLAHIINQLNPNGFEYLGKTSAGKWIQIAYDTDERAAIHAAIHCADTPPITRYAWDDALLEHELWIPAAWCEEVQHAS
ncbi:MAG: hypothetical protein F6K00_19760 [Leptolyngbya sp. SIOISBB]|nr:hypothetical protein [Leptolyngbya sp. SIOISBB]